MESTGRWDRNKSEEEHRRNEKTERTSGPTPGKVESLQRMATGSDGLGNQNYRMVPIPGSNLSFCT